MFLRIYNRFAPFSHENEQFRRVAHILKELLENFKWEGVLIGNPISEEERFFCPDAIFYYKKALVLIDFKDYQGILDIPNDVDNFANSRWFIGGDKKVEIKGGNSYINPFRQLLTYRHFLKNLLLEDCFDLIDKNKIINLNIFSGPISSLPRIPKNYPFYKLTDEEHLCDTIVDLCTESEFYESVAQGLIKKFPCEPYKLHIHIAHLEDEQKKISRVDDTKYLVDIFNKEHNVHTVALENLHTPEISDRIINFLKSDCKILVLSSMSRSLRLSWASYINSIALDYGRSAVHQFAYSQRIANKVKGINFIVGSLYNLLYKGNWEELSNEDTSDDDCILVKHIANNKEEFGKSLFVINEAHLVTRSFFQTEMIRFGSGKILDDLAEFTKDIDCKIIFIGDSYSLSYGSVQDYAMSLDSLKVSFGSDIKIDSYFEPSFLERDDYLNLLKVELCNSIEHNLFNRLLCKYDNRSVCECSNELANQKLKEWFFKPLTSSPREAILVYTNKMAYLSNLYIKKHILKNGELLSKGDLLITDNNTTQEKDNNYVGISNGTYLSVLEVLPDRHNISIKIKRDKDEIFVNLSYVRAIVKHLDSGTVYTVWLIENFLNSEFTKSEIQQLMHINYYLELKGKQKEHPFTESDEYLTFVHSVDREFQNKVINCIADSSNRTLSSWKKAIKDQIGDKEKGKEICDKLSQCYREYEKPLKKQVSLSPIVNALIVKYGWALTVHKAVGLNYDGVIISCLRKDNDNLVCDDYFRWLYSAISCAESVVYMKNFQNIYSTYQSIFKKGVNFGLNQSAKSKYICVSNYEMPNDLKPFVDHINNTNIKYVVSLLTHLLKEEKLKLKDVQVKNEFLVKACFSSAVYKELVILDIYAKGAKEHNAVSSVKISKADPQLMASINRAIDSIFNDLSDNKTIENGSDANLANFLKFSYSLWEKELKERNFNFIHKCSSKYQDVFSISNKETHTYMRVWYNKELFFTKFEFTTTDEQLVKTISDIINNASML